MKFISLQENFKKGIFSVNNITSKNITLPILNNILIKTEDGIINLIATNLEIGITYKVGGKIEKNGEITVNSKIISDYVNNLPNEKISIESIENNKELKIQCKNYKTKIKSEKSDDFPLIPTIEKKDYIKTNIKKIKEALSQVIFSVSNSDSRIEISGILFFLDGKKLKLVSTDSYRLSEKTIEIEDNINNEKLKGEKIIIPAKTIQELLRILSNIDNEEDDIKIYFSDNQILFSFGPVELISRTVNGQYPDYEQIIPKDFNSEIILNRQELIRAIKVSSIFSRDSINDININVKKEEKEIIVSSFSGQSGESNIKIEADIKKNDSKIKLNYRYLLEGLNNIKSENIIINIIDENSPCLIRSNNNDGYVYIIMPIKQ